MNFLWYLLGLFVGLMLLLGNALTGGPESMQIGSGAPAPIYTCDETVPIKLDNGDFRFATSATVINGAEIVSYTYDFGDGYAQTTTGAWVDHHYTMSGTYYVTATVNVKVHDTLTSVTSSSCQTTVKVNTP
jgi:hypothetical protein